MKTLKPRKKTLTLLGSSGSIGKNTLDVVARHREKFDVFALAVNTSVQVLAEQIKEFSPQKVVVSDGAAAAKLKEMAGTGGPEILSGNDALIEIAAHEETDHVVSGMVGAVGLRPTFGAIEAGKEVSVANKETLVLAGELMVKKAAETGSRLLPMDSEHNAIFQCLQGAQTPPDRLILTASGGPFRDLDLDRFGEITLEQALNHPNWDMGPKITIDSATMMNKGLEVIEARWFFQIPPENIDVLIHRQSIVHSLVEFADKSVLAQLGLPDMRVPISYCLGFPKRLPMDLPSLNLAEVGQLDFQAVSQEKFPCLFLAIEALKSGGGATAVLNGANEEVVAAYLAGGFPFCRIADTLIKVMQKFQLALHDATSAAYLREVTDVESALKADQWGREVAIQLMGAET